jgi:catalase
VLNEAARERLVGNIVGHLLNGVSEQVMQRAFVYRRNVESTWATGSRRASAPDRHDW